MNGLTGAMLGVMVAGGLLLIAAGFRRVSGPQRQQPVLDGRATEERPSWGYQRLLGSRLSTATAA